MENSGNENGNENTLEGCGHSHEEVQNGNKNNKVNGRHNKM